MVGLCRLCASLRKMDVLILIKDDSNEICEKLRKCCQLNIKMQDPLPKSICQDCMENLNNSHKFYTKVKEAQETLQALYPTPSVQDDGEIVIETVEPVAQTSLVQALSVVEENVKKRKSCKMEQETEKFAKQNEMQEENTKIPTKQIKLEKPKDLLTKRQVNENVLTEPKQTPSNCIEEVCQMLEMTKEEVSLECSFEVLESIEENVQEDLNEEHYSYQDAQSQVVIQEEHHVAEVENDKSLLNIVDDEEQVTEISESRKDLLIPDKDFNMELEYLDIYEEEEDDEQMDIEESMNKNLHLLPTQLKLKSWKNYNYLCFICNQILTNFTALKTHIGQNHNLIQTDNFKYKCYDCKKTIPRYNFFLNHIRSKHHPDLKLKCEVCDLTCQNFEELSYHRIDNCKEAKTFPSIVPCNQCFKSFHNAYGLQNHHKLQHLNSKVKVKYQCEDCNKEFQYKSCLKVHAQVHTDRKTYSCSICGNIFYSKIGLDQHIFSHVEDKTYKCNFCNKSFKTYQSLDHHQIIHSEEKSFKCEFCDKTFHKKIQKITHERTHTGEMPFPCDQCDKRFRFRSALNAHVKGHTGIKPYSCEYCDKTFADSSNRNKHVRRKHANNV